MVTVAAFNWPAARQVISTTGDHSLVRIFDHRLVTRFLFWGAACILCLSSYCYLLRGASPRGTFIRPLHAWRVEAYSVRLTWKHLLFQPSKKQLLTCFSYKL